MTPPEFYSDDLMAGPPPTRLPEDPAAASIAAGDDPRSVVKGHPESPLAWAVLAEQTLAAGDDDVAGYAFAHGPVPWDHVPNRGFLRALAALTKAAAAIGETAEEQRCGDFLRDSSRAAYDALM
jgi:hypothetical protein